MRNSGNIQTCIYQDEVRKMVINIPEEWTYALEKEFKGDENREGSPDFGIQLYIDGDTNNNIYFFYQHGTLNFQEPGITSETLKTKQGRAGKLSTAIQGDTRIIFVTYDIGHYAILARLDNNVFNANKKEIYKVIKSSYIEEL